MKGYIHSLESFGTVDGPGIRYVVFFQGCPMRCMYCHNPDTWTTGEGTLMDAEELLRPIERNRFYYSTGGITATGGEPLMQLPFLTELFEKAHEKGIHTCLDTSGIAFRPGNEHNQEDIDRLLLYTDYVMLDIKHIDNEEHRKLTGHSNKRVLAFARYLDKKNIPFRVRHVIVPTITNLREPLYELGQFLGTLRNLDFVEILPYHSMAKEKYERLEIEYPLMNLKDLTNVDAEKALQIVKEGMLDPDPYKFS